MVPTPSAFLDFFKALFSFAIKRGSFLEFFLLSCPLLMIITFSRKWIYLKSVWANLRTGRINIYEYVTINALKHQYGPIAKELIAIIILFKYWIHPQAELERFAIKHEQKGKQVKYELRAGRP